MRTVTMEAPMLGITRRRYVVPAALALIATVAPSAAAVQDPIPVGPNAYFTAQVNGVSAQAVIKVVCPGPVSSTSTGHPISGQTLEVFRLLPPTTVTVGYTGSAAHQIDAIFSAPPSAAGNPPVVLSSFFAPVAIPTSLVLPCGGSGVVSFVPIPTSPTARGFAVTVVFENIAV
jgi:hypothetical protein